MLTATDGVLLPTTVTGSWPRPAWFDLDLKTRTVSDGMTDVRYREQFTDAVAAVISEQERAGLDIVTNGDFHLDGDLGGRSWISYVAERLDGFSRTAWRQPGDEWAYPAGTMLHEIMGGWRYPPVVGKVEASKDKPLELDKIWRVAQGRTDRPVKIGIASAQVIASILSIETDLYDDDKRQLVWDTSVAVNKELRALADAGCTVIQLEEPMMHFISAVRPDEELVGFYTDCANRELEGLQGVEVWVHTCWGNPNAQSVLKETTYTDEAFHVFLERLNCDVWTVEMKDRGFRNLEVFGQYRETLRASKKKVAIGIVSHRTLQADSAEDVAADIRRCLEFIEPEHLVLSTDCGFGRQGGNRLAAFYKATAIAQGANIVRRELGAEERPIRALDPRTQIDPVKRKRSVAISESF